MIQPGKLTRHTSRLSDRGDTGDPAALPSPGERPARHRAPHARNGRPSGDQMAEPPGGRQRLPPAVAASRGCATAARGPSHERQRVWRPRPRACGSPIPGPARAADESRHCLCRSGGTSQRRPCRLRVSPLPDRMECSSGNHAVKPPSHLPRRYGAVSNARSARLHWRIVYVVKTDASMRVSLAALDRIR
jgi:hypothetical protein